jgi:DNA-binding PadR family transcriptional regulator
MWKLEDVLDRINELDKLGGLRFITLHVLEDGPKNGTEVMNSIQEHREQINQMNLHSKCQEDQIICPSSLKPSSGSVYPLLKKLEAEGLLIKRMDGRYELTEAGHQTIYKISGNLLNHSDKKPIDRSAIAIETALNEIDSYINFIEDIKQEKLAKNKERIAIFIKRLEKIKNSLET